MRIPITFYGFLLLFSAVACMPESQPSADLSAKEGPLQIVCTTGMLGDAISRIAGDRAEVTNLMGPGVDPHLYKATQGDLKRLTGADVVFYNGLHLEGKMGEVLDKVARLKPVIALGDSIPTDKLINSTDYASAYDPHIWFDVSLWSEAVGIAGHILADLDTAYAKTYRANTEAFQHQLAQLHAFVQQEINRIPPEQRILITAHDAFEYFGEAYGIEVRGLQGISTVSEYGLKDVSDLVNLITSRNIKAIFVESSVPRKSLEAVVEGCAKRGHTTRIGGTLYSDAMGEAGTPEGTYPGMVRANVRTIVEALR